MMSAPKLLVACTLSLSACASAPPPVTEVSVAPPRVAPQDVAAEEVPATVGIVGISEDSRFDNPATRRVHGPGYHYDIVSGWEELDATTLGSALILHAQRALTLSGDFAQNVNVANEPFVGDGPAYGAANLVELAKLSSVRANRAAQVGPRPGWDIEAYWPNPGGVPYITLQRYATTGRQGFVITCSSGASTFAAERGVCDAILDSFRVE